MSFIKNIRLIEGLLSQEQLEKLNTGARMYRQHGRIEFKINGVDSDQIEIRIVQSKNPTENYLTKKELIERAKDFISPFFPELKVNVRAYEYKLPVVDVVTPEWIQAAMTKYKVSLKKIAFDTGIDNTSLSAVINGLKPLSQSMKALFYYYFGSIMINDLFEKDYSNSAGGTVFAPKIFDKSVIDQFILKITKESKRKAELTDRADAYYIIY